MAEPWEDPPQETRDDFHLQGPVLLAAAGAAVAALMIFSAVYTVEPSEEAVILPGQMILGADSHRAHFGWMGAFGAGIGRSEVAALLAMGPILPRAINDSYATARSSALSLPAKATTADDA